ncbi:Uncharacterised protein g7663 [Pycnogonum litorale]
MADSNLTESGGNVIINEFVWCPNAVKLLISLYFDYKDDFQENKILKKHLWKKIAMKMTENGYVVSSVLSDKKWRNLKRTYVNIRDHNRQSGRGRKRWEYYSLMDDAIGDKAANSSLSLSQFTNAEPVTAESLLNSIQNCEMPEAGEQRIPDGEQMPEGSRILEDELTEIPSIEPDVSLVVENTFQAPQVNDNPRSSAQMSGRRKRKAPDVPPKWFATYFDNKKKQLDEHISLQRETIALQREILKKQEETSSKIVEELRKKMS